jgi:hypothetical protein
MAQSRTYEKGEGFPDRRWTAMCDKGGVQAEEEVEEGVPIPSVAFLEDQRWDQGMPKAGLGRKQPDSERDLPPC